MSFIHSRILTALTLFSAVGATACGGPTEGPANTGSSAETELSQRHDAALAESLNTTPTA